MRDLIEDLARFMFDGEAADYDADPALVEAAWADDQIRAPWVRRATDVLDFLTTHPSTAPQPA